MFVYITTIQTRLEVRHDGRCMAGSENFNCEHLFLLFSPEVFGEHDSKKAFLIPFHGLLLWHG